MFSGTASPLATKEKKSMRKAASKYLREVKKNLRCPYSLRAEFLNQLADELFLYCEEHDDVDTADLSAHFGLPEDVAKEFMAELGGKAAGTVSQARQRILCLTAALVIIAAAVVAAVNVYTAYKQYKILDGYYIEAITYEEETNPFSTAPTFFIDTFNDLENSEK